MPANSQSGKRCGYSPGTWLISPWPGIPGYSNPEFSFRILSGRLIAGIEKTLISPELFPASPAGSGHAAHDRFEPPGQAAVIGDKQVGWVKRKKKKGRESQAPGMAISGTPRFITLDSWDGKYGTPRFTA
jgi:hypothetical protein